MKWCNHCVKSVRIRSYSGPYFPAFRLNTDQENSKYGHFSQSEFYYLLNLTVSLFPSLLNELISF